MKTAQKFAANFISNAASDRHFYFQLMLNCACRGTWRQSLHKEPKGSLDADQAHIPPFLTGGVEGGVGGAGWSFHSLLAKLCECSHDLLLSFQKLWKEGYFLLCSQSTHRASPPFKSPGAKFKDSFCPHVTFQFATREGSSY